MCADDSYVREKLCPQDMYCPLGTSSPMTLGYLITLIILVIITIGLIWIFIRNNIRQRRKDREQRAIDKMWVMNPTATAFLQGTPPGFPSPPKYSDFFVKDYSKMKKDGKWDPQETSFDYQNTQDENLITTKEKEKDMN